MVLLPAASKFVAFLPSGCALLSHAGIISCMTSSSQGECYLTATVKVRSAFHQRDNCKHSCCQLCVLHCQAIKMARSVHIRRAYKLVMPPAGTLPVIHLKGSNHPKVWTWVQSVQLCPGQSRAEKMSATSLAPTQSGACRVWNGN